MLKEDSIPVLFGRAIRAIHCVGIGGMGVGPLAIYLAQRGFRVSGEDNNLSDAMRTQLRKANITVTEMGAIPAEAELVAYSSAISAAHPACRNAQERKLGLVRRGELLAEATRDRKLVAVCGSHGKTTTTAMLISALRTTSFPSGYVLGGLFNDAEIPPSRPGDNEWVVAEIDESDGTIAHFSPEITVVVNLDWDHPDHYRQLADLQATFAALFQRTRRAILLNDACALSAHLSASVRDKMFFTFGRTGDYQGRIVGENEPELQLALAGRFPLAQARVRARGEFNGSNATAALAAADLMGAFFSPAALADYPGVRRRQTVLHATADCTVVEDYAHHPAEIRALLASLRSHGSGRVLAVFQPHRFSRTAQFKTEFAAALASADRVYLLDVYSAGENPLIGGTSADLYSELKAKAASLSVNYCPGEAGATLAQLSRDLRRGDLVAFIGAGDIEQHARAWIKHLEERLRAEKQWNERADTLRLLVSSTTKVKREESLAEKTTIRVGGAARIYAEPATIEDTRALLVAARKNDIPVQILGRGSNLIVPDEGVNGLVLNFSHANWQTFEPRPDGSVWVGAGLRLKNLCGLAIKAGLVGFEFLEGIPGNVGGALRMNAGAMGGWMFDVVLSVQLITRSGEVRLLQKSEIHVDYRHCGELNEGIALGALLQPKAAGSAENVASQVEVYREKRQKSQPREPSAGCIFKNPAGASAGRLIDEAGLKGERVGDAEVSSVHANFIVNRGHATSADVIELVRRIRARVEQAKGIRLEPEVLLYGQAWKDVL